MCYERVEAGGQTACAEACALGATVFGDRDEMIAEARKRISENPGQYIDYIYGLREAGGTSVLFLSGVPFETLGFPMHVPQEPIPDLSWRVLSQIPRYTVAAGVVLFGIHWITSRRADVARFEAEEERRENDSTHTER
jgi:formate dehydrogenase iron-sulfur subunit